MWLVGRLELPMNLHEFYDPGRWLGTSDVSSMTPFWGNYPLYERIYSIQFSKIVFVPKGQVKGQFIHNRNKVEDEAESIMTSEVLIHENNIFSYNTRRGKFRSAPMKPSGREGRRDSTDVAHQLCTYGVQQILPQQQQLNYFQFHCFPCFSSLFLSVSLVVSICQLLKTSFCHVWLKLCQRASVIPSCVCAKQISHLIVWLYHFVRRGKR